MAATQILLYVIYEELVEQVFNLIFLQRYQDRGRQGALLIQSKAESNQIKSETLR